MRKKLKPRNQVLRKSQDDEIGKRLAAEKKINEARAARLAKKQADLAAKAEEAARPAPAEEDTTPAPAEGTAGAPAEGESSAEAVADDKPQE